MNLPVLTEVKISEANWSLLILGCLPSGVPAEHNRCSDLSCLFFCRNPSLMKTVSSDPTFGSTLSATLQVTCRVSWNLQIRAFSLQEFKPVPILDQCAVLWLPVYCKGSEFVEMIVFSTRFFFKIRCYEMTFHNMTMLIFIGRYKRLKVGIRLLTHTQETTLWDPSHTTLLTVFYIVSAY